MKEAISKELKSSKTIKFQKPKHSGDMVDEGPSNFPPSFSLSTKQLSQLTSKGIGDDCEFYIKTKVVGINKDEGEAAQYRFDVQEMTYDPSKKKKESSSGESEPIKKAYDKATGKDPEKKYVTLATQQTTG